MRTDIKDFFNFIFDSFACEREKNVLQAITNIV